MDLYERLQLYYACRNQANRDKQFALRAMQEATYTRFMFATGLLPKELESQILPLLNQIEVELYMEQKGIKILSHSAKPNYISTMLEQRLMCYNAKLIDTKEWRIFKLIVNHCDNDALLEELLEALMPE